MTNPCYPDKLSCRASTTNHVNRTSQNKGYPPQPAGVNLSSDLWPLVTDNAAFFCTDINHLLIPGQQLAPHKTMKNRYNDLEAQQFIANYPDYPPEMGLRVYTSRLIGQEEDLVLHGGGNTSAKATITTLLGDKLEVIYVKGSGWDLGDIEPAGLPGLDLAYLRRLRQLEQLSDEEMVNQFRTHLLDASSPNPSIETLVHAFLPHRFIDHTHADAIVTLTNQPEAEDLLQEALGDKIGILPFIMPGFPLAQAVISLLEQHPEMECLILRNHGIFTFADDAKTAYGRMIDYVSRAEDFITAKMAQKPLAASPEIAAPDSTTILPLLRGNLTFTEPSGYKRRFHLHLRQSPAILTQVNHPHSAQLYGNGVLTPDHVIRTKNYPLLLDFGACVDEESCQHYLQQAIAQYQANYISAFTTQCQSNGVTKTQLDPLPRVILIKGLGIVTAGKTIKECQINADICEHTLRAKSAAAAIGSYAELDPASIFAMEYWSLEQAKVGRGKPAPLEGKIALVTGGGGAIAVGISRQLLRAGARVVLADINEERLEIVRTKLAQEYGAMVSSLALDVTSAPKVQQAFSTLIRQTGGLDILVANAGIAHVDRLVDLTTSDLEKVLAVNLTGTFHIIKAAIPIFRRQGHGGHIIVNSSKNVFAPGAAFGAYSASKAGAHQLGKIAALELAEIDVRVNMINADAIFDDGEVSSGLWDVIGPDRMKSRELDPQGLKEYYRQRNLLKTEILADHVGNGVVFFASGLTPTTGATLPIDGGIMAAFPR